MTWDGIVTTHHHRGHLKEMGIKRNIKACIQAVVLLKTLTSMLASRRQLRVQLGRCNRERLSTKAVMLMGEEKGYSSKHVVQEVVESTEGKIPLFNEAPGVMKKCPGPGLFQALIMKIARIT